METFFKKYGIFFLILILALSVFFRLYQIKTIPPALYPDEAMNGVNALNANATGDYKTFYPDNNGREGLFINIQALSIKYFGNEPWALRVVSSLFGILTVLGLYLLTKEMFGNEFVALFASFFMATSFWHVNFSRIGFRAIMAPMFLTWSLWLLFKIVNKFEARSTKHETNSNNGNSKVSNILNFDIVSDFGFRISCLAILGGLIFGLGFHSYIAYRAAPIILVPVFLWLLFKMRWKGALVIFFFGIGAMIAIAPLANFNLHFAKYGGSFCRQFHKNSRNVFCSG